MAQISSPKLHLPELHRPDEHLPEWKLPHLRAPELDVHALSRLGRPAQRRRNLLPWVVLGSAGALAGGWFLATSSATGPRVRTAVGRLRRRVEVWRNGGGDWDDEVEQSTERFWSNESGWKEEGSRGGLARTSDPAGE